MHLVDGLRGMIMITEVPVKDKNILNKMLESIDDFIFYLRQWAVAFHHIFYHTCAGHNLILWIDM